MRAGALGDVGKSVKSLLKTSVTAIVSSRARPTQQFSRLAWSCETRRLHPVGASCPGGQPLRGAPAGAAESRRRQRHAQHEHRRDAGRPTPGQHDGQRGRLLSSKKPSDLVAAEGREELADQVKDEANDVLGYAPNPKKKNKHTRPEDDGPVLSVLFNQFIVQ